MIEISAFFKYKKYVSLLKVSIKLLEITLSLYVFTSLNSCLFLQSDMYSKK